MNSICKFEFVKNSLLFVLVGLLVCWLAPVLDGKSTSEKTREPKQFFGIANMYPGKRPGAQCPQCAECPAPCPTTQPAFLSMNINTGDCAQWSSGATLSACAKTTGASSGTISIAFLSQGNTVSQPYSTAFFGILSACPNNTVTLQCGNIPSGISVITQNHMMSNGLSLVTSPPSAVETNSMLVIIQLQGILASVPANVVCTWASSP